MQRMAACELTSRSERNIFNSRISRWSRPINRKARRLIAGPYISLIPSCSTRSHALPRPKQETIFYFYSPSHGRHSPISSVPHWHSSSTSSANALVATAVSMVMAKANISNFFIFSPPFRGMGRNIAVCADRVYRNRLGGTLFLILHHEGGRNSFHKRKGPAISRRAF